MRALEQHSTCHLVPATHYSTVPCSNSAFLLCRFVILLSDDKDYFFVLYLVYVGMNMLLAGIALLHWPGAEQLELVNDPEGYQVRFCSGHLPWMVTHKLDQIIW